MIKEDITYCSSSFLMYRIIIDSKKCFDRRYLPNIKSIPANRTAIHDADELYNSLKEQIDNLLKKKQNVGLCLSGGIDSAILAKMLPKGTMTYTFKCVVPGIEVTDETPMAKKYAEDCSLRNKVIEIYWEDFEKYAPILMKHKGAPIHSIEVQMYKAALEAKKDGIDVLIYGESSDLNYGGLSGLLSKDWTFGEFVDRYSYVLPYKVLKEYELEFRPYHECEKNGYIDVHKFNTTSFLKEALNSYYNACETADILCFMPYSNTYLAEKLDLERIRSGENKYIVREVFNKLYKDYSIPEKIPMPRPMNEWLKDWKGPTRKEFWPNCTDNMSGDQKWQVWCLEKFLNYIDSKK